MEETTKKQFTYRGKTLEELKKLDVREIEKFVNRAREKIAMDKPIRTHSRKMIIVPELVGMKIFVHMGNKFTPVDITGDMLGHILGEFALTRGRVKHGSAGIGATKGTKAEAK